MKNENIEKLNKLPELKELAEKIYKNTGVRISRFYIDGKKDAHKIDRLQLDNEEWNPRRLVTVVPSMFDFRPTYCGERLLESMGLAAMDNNHSYLKDAYSRISVSIDVNLIDRFIETKNIGGDLEKRLERIIGEPICDLLENLERISLKLIEATSTDSGIVDIFQDNASVDNMSGLFGLDLLLVWYLDRSLVKCVPMKEEDDIVKKYKSIVYALRPNNIELASRLMNTILKSHIVEGESDFFDSIMFNYERVLGDTNLYTKFKNLKYKPLLTNDVCNRNSDCEATPVSCYAESLSYLGASETDSRSYLELSFQAMTNKDLKPLYGEALFKKSSNSLKMRNKLTELARRIDKFTVEAEFMYDKFSKKDTLDNGYEIIKDIDKLYEQSGDRNTKMELENLRDEIFVLIKNARGQDIRKARNTINISYPSGYEG